MTDTLEVRDIGVVHDHGSLWYHGENRYTIELQVAVPDDMTHDDLLEMIHQTHD